MIDYGAATYDVAPPNGAIYVRRGASNNNPGSMTEPVGSVAKALQLAPIGGTVAVYQALGDGPYTEGGIAQGWRKPVTIQAVPGERPLFRGSAPFPDGWVSHAAGVWKRVGTVLPAFDRAPADPVMLDPEHPEACWPERVTVGADVGLRKTPVSRGGGTANPEVLEGEYSYDVAGKVMYIGVDPADGVRISVKSVCMTGSQDSAPTSNHPAFNLHGLTFSEWAVESRQIGAVRVFGHGSSITNCVWERCAAAGLFVQLGRGMRLWDNEYRNCGQLGLHGYRIEDLEVFGSVIEGNNVDLYTTDQVAGGAKVDTRSTNTTVGYNLIAKNFGHGWWSDLGSTGLRLLYNIVLGHEHGAGLYGELSRDVMMLSNWVEGNLIGCMHSGGAQDTIAYNTFVNNRHHIRGQRDRRCDEVGQVYSHAQQDYNYHSNLFVQTIPDNEIGLIEWEDYRTPRVGWDKVNLTVDHNLVRRVPNTGNYAVLSTATEQKRRTPTLVDFQSMTGLGADSQESVGAGVNPAFAALPVQGAGRPMNAAEAALLGVTPEEALAPNVGWYGPQYVADPPPPPPTPVPNPEVPVPYDVLPLGNALVAVMDAVADLEPAVADIIAEVRRLEDVIDGLKGANLEAEVEIEQLNGEIDKLRVALQERDLLLADRDALILNLQARIDELEDDTPVGVEERIAPILVGNHLLGWSAKPGTLAAFEAVGKQMGAAGQSRRVFPSGEQDIEVDVAAGRVPFTEIALYASNDEADALAARVAALAPAPVMITIGHEEERKDKGRSSADFLSHYLRLFPRLEVAPNAVIGSTLMNWTLRLQNPWVGNTMDAVRAWLPPKGLCHFLGVDLYVMDTTAPGQTIAKQTENAIAFATELGVHLAFAEFAINGTEEQRRAYAEQWCYTMHVWAQEKRPYSALLTEWFNSTEGGNVPLVFDGTRDWSIFKAADKADALTPKVWKDFITTY